MPEPHANQISEARFTRFPGKPHRLFIIVHGMGGNGAWELDGYTEAAQTVMYGNVLFAFPTFVEQEYSVCGAGSDETLYEYITARHADTDLGITPSTTCIGGFSGGSQFTHRFVYRHPELFAAAAPISGGSWTLPDSTPIGMLVDYPESRWGKFPEILESGALSRAAEPGFEKVRWFIACGELDTQRLSSSKRMAEALREAGASVQYCTYPMAHHLDVRMKTEIVRFFEESTPLEGQNRPEPRADEG